MRELLWTLARVTSVHSLSKREAMSKVPGICAFSHEYLYSMSLWKAETLSRELFSF